MPKTQYTRIYNKFTGYTTADCDCQYCLNYSGKRRGCKLDACCCAAERQQALEREGSEAAYTCQA